MHLAIDPRDRDLARLLVTFSTRVKEGDIAIIECVGSDALGLARACLEEILAAGATPYLYFSDPIVTRTMLKYGSEAVFKKFGVLQLDIMKHAQVYIGIRGSDNPFELKGIAQEKLESFSKFVTKPVHLEQRVKHTRWVVLRYPNASMAQLAQMSTEEFADFYYRACLADYPTMKKVGKKLKALMDQTEKVRIIGPGTDLSFSIAAIPSILCCGEMNVPDGECFTAPVRESVEGVVQFNTPSVWEGQPFENIRLVFKKGKVVSAEAATPEQTRKLQSVLDRDRGARYIGEFALGFHPVIREPMRDILFDEKIAGSFHMALGQCYDEAPNGNRSQIHWDLVCIQRPEYGGGEIWFDGKLVRKDGNFVAKSLQPLNPAPESTRPEHPKSKHSSRKQ